MHWFLLFHFLRRPQPGRDPLAVMMCGARMGERILQIGVDPALTGALASKAGLNGNAATLVSNDTMARRARAAAEASGALIDVTTAVPPPWPYTGGAFDLVVVHARQGLAAALGSVVPVDAFRECHRVLRPGGRIVVIQAGTGGWMSGLIRRNRSGQTEPGHDARADLEAAAFKPVRGLGDREGYAFTEGIR